MIRQLEQGPPFSAPVEMRIYGPNLKRLQELGEQARSLLVQIPKVTPRALSGVYNYPS